MAGTDIEDKVTEKFGDFTNKVDPLWILAPDRPKPPHVEIIVDCDGTLANTHLPWLAKYNSDYDDHLTVADIIRWDMSTLVKPECGRKIYDYLKDEDLYEQADVINGALEGVKALREFGEVTFLTSGFFVSKMKWLWEKGFSIAREPEFMIDYHFMPDVWVGHKKQKLKGHIIIDDYIKNIKGFQVPILFAQPWNDFNPADVDFTYMRAADWPAVVNMVRHAVNTQEFFELL